MNTISQSPANLKLSTKDAEYLVSYIERLTGKSKLEDIRFAAWEMSQSYVCRNHREIAIKIDMLMRQATGSRKQAVKQAAIDAVHAYIQSVTTIEETSPTNLKLSAAQIRCLHTMQQGARPLPLSAIAETQRMNKLIKFGLVDCRDGVYCPEYFLTFNGKHLLEDLSRIEASAAIEGEAPTDATLSDELPAYQLARQHNTLTYVCGKNGLPEMDDSDDIEYSEEDMFALCAAAPKKNGGPAQVKFLDDGKKDETVTAPVRFVGDVVIFRYFLDSAFSLELFEGVIVDKKHDFFSGWMYRIAVLPSDEKAQRYNLTPRWVANSYIKSVIATDKPEGDIEGALYAEQQRLMMLVSPAYMAYEQAILDKASAEMIKRLDYAHRAAEDAFKAAKQAYLDYRPTAPQTPQNGATADIRAVEVYSSAMSVETPVQPSARIKGIVTYYNALKGFGYILSDDSEEFYFQSRNLQYAAMPIQKSNVVTFDGLYGTGAHSGMPKACVILVDGYTPDPRPTHKVSPSIAQAALGANLSGEIARHNQRAFKKQQDVKNDASMKRMMGGGL